MMHISVPVANTMEYISATEISPLISKCQIKVCYVSEQANRNGTVITKEVATEFGKKLPGSPIVGFYNEEEKDFEEHNREFIVEGEKFKIIDTTKPYGFVDISAPVWFQKFKDDDGVEREYLCTEGYLWTGAYPECQRAVDQGNNQSMEINKDSQKGFWTNDSNSGKRIFIINDGLIEKLCILGQNYEPCFEGSQVKSNFSLENNPDFAEFKATMFSMINEIKDALSKGGSNETMEDNKNLDPQVQEEETNPTGEFKQKPEDENKDNTSSDNENKNTEEEDKKKKEKEYKCGEGSEEKKKKDYNLNEVAEYVALSLEYNNLKTQYNELQEKFNSLNSEVETLRTFKLTADRKSKQDMIDSFYMLSDEDKKDVTDHLDMYSLEDIEAKLSVVCFRKKINFNLEEEQQKEENPLSQQLTFNLNQNTDDGDSAPEWVKAVLRTQNKEG